MKVTKELRDIYQDGQRAANRQKEFVDQVLRPLCVENDWYYLARVKSESSFALKIETGRFESPQELEDLFAVTIVVPTFSQIKLVIEHIEAQDFKIEHQRPADLDTMTKSPDAFSFDDLRLYVKYAQPPSLPYNEDLDRIFEIQIKTFLQHAWSIATHDLIYKSDKIDWMRERILYQIKAMLEHAEETIVRIDKVADTLESKRFEKYDVINQLIDVYKRFWDQALLPSDLKRLGETTYKLIDKLGIRIDQVIEAIEEAETKGLAGKALNLSPYQSLIVALYMKDEQVFATKLKSLKIPITSEMLDVAPDLNVLKSNAISLQR